MFAPAAGKDYSKVINEECGTGHEEDVVATQVSLRTNNCVKSNDQRNKVFAQSCSICLFMSKS